jgi:hypothetical protein
MSTDLAVTGGIELVNVETGEFLPATVENAAVVLHAARTMKRRLDNVIAETTSFLLAESQVRGTKTLEAGREKITLTGGPTVDYDTTDLMDALREAGCPEERIAEAVIEEISYKPNRSVLRQLAAANPDYRAAVELAERTIEKPWRASVK